ncbi:MAG: 3'-5' exoribonuclease [Candidatus Firestonebacteria bacterium]|nr:3'-5' exoribonuclease [Candidatus Firestonebacteria bacterium]
MKKNIGTFIAFDLETTGFDCKTDRIIEIGAVKVIDGEIIECFNELVNPEIPIPYKITNLTGIKSEDVKDKPSISFVLEKFVTFIKDFPLVAHNVEFDRNFIDENFLKTKHRKITNKFYDTLFLSRIIFPFTSSHKLKDMLTYLDIKSTAHRAASDAEACAHLWMKLWEEAENLSSGTIADIFAITENIDWAYKEFFAKIKHMGSNPKKINKQEHILKGSYPSYTSLLDSKTIENYFVPNGKLSRVLDKFEYRKQQNIMARKAIDTFKNNEILILETGTGTGKTMAYLIPALHYAIAHNTGVIISTNTKNLQEQLFNKDIPILRKAVDFSFKVTLLKGRNNYICLRKYYWMLKALKQTLREEDVLNLLTLVRWIYETTTGDISENAGFNHTRFYGLWNRLNCDDEACAGKKCSYSRDCFMLKVREEARHSHLVIVNHTLFFLDRGNSLNILPEFKNYIFDEAHNLEKVAMDCMGKTIIKNDFMGPINSMYGIDKNKKEYGLLITLKYLLPSDSEQIDAIIKKIPILKEAISSLWDLLRKNINNKKNGNGKQVKTRLTKKNEICELLKIIPDEFINKFDTINSSLDRLIENSWTKYKDEKKIEDILLNLAAKFNELQECLDNLEFFFESDDPNYVYWMEWDGIDSNECFLEARPLNIAEKMQELLYAGSSSIIFSSATLAVENNFLYFKERMGLSLLENVKEVLLDSPFDYNAQSLFIVPTYLPLPAENSFNNAVAEIIFDIALKLRGKNLILFTSYIQLNYVYECLESKLEENGILILGQGIDGSRRAITDRFREVKDALLFGTQSFWEGVDFLGVNMKSLVLVKIPFPVPNEPQVEAQIELIEKNGGDSFGNYMIPQAITKLRQGFGRLIRCSEDSGIVFVLDKRIVTSSYGHKFLEALPVRNTIANNEAELISKITGWR